jgi:HK97 family phage prohead protease
MHGTKTVTVPRLKADVEDGLAHGEALAMISLYGVKDHDGDRVKAGAFDEFAQAFDAEQMPLSMVWQHGRNPEDHVGEVLGFDPHAVDDKGREGMAAKVRFDIDSDIGLVRDRARQAYKLVKGRRVNQWSYAWDGETSRLADGSRELTKMSLSEVSPVLRGALSETSTLAVKQEADEGTPAEEAADLSDFQRTWAGIGEMIATDADLVEWLADANGPDVAGVVTCIETYIEADMAQEAYQTATTGVDEDSGDTPYFKQRKVDPVMALARVQLDLPEPSTA